MVVTMLRCWGSLLCAQRRTCMNNVTPHLLQEQGDQLARPGAAAGLHLKTVRVLRGLCGGPHMPVQRLPQLCRLWPPPSAW